MSLLVPTISKHECFGFFCTISILVDKELIFQLCSKQIGMAVMQLLCSTPQRFSDHFVNSFFAVGDPGPESQCNIIFAWTARPVLSDRSPAQLRPRFSQT